MAREQKISACGINVRVHPHESGAYERLFRKAFKLRRAIQVHGDTHFILASMGADDRKQPKYLLGELARFTKIDTDLPWFNMETLKPAADEDVEKIRIPPSLRPNFRSFYFAFDLSKHHFYFQSFGEGHGLSPFLVQKFLERLLSSDEMAAEFGIADLTILPSRESLERIFALPELRELEIYIERPNPDDWATLESDVKQRMDSQRLSSMTTRYKSQRDKSITPDGSTKLLAEVAANNGYVAAKGRDDEGRPLEESTSEHPHYETDYVDPDVESKFEAFLRLTRLIRSKHHLPRRRK